MAEPTGQSIGAVSRDGTRARRFTFLWAIVFAIGLVAVFLAASNLLHDPSEGLFPNGSYPTSTIQNGLFILALIASGIGGLGLVFTLYDGLLRPREWFTFFTDGFTYRRVNGRQETSQSYRWADLAHYWHSVTKVYTNGIYTGDRRILTWIMQDGTRYVIDNSFKGIASVADPMLKVTYEPLMQKAYERLRAGETISFGVVSVSPMGLVYNNKTLAWADVANVTSAKGYIAIWARNPGNPNRPRRFLNIRFAQIPDALVLWEIASKFSTAKPL
jgi:hypothetical protein